MTMSKKKQRKKKRRQQQRDEAELVGSRLAYESGIHWLDANVRALEALRTRSLALVSVVLIAATVVANLAPDAVKEGTLGFCGWAGVVIFALSTAVLIVACALCLVACQVHCRAWSSEDHREARCTHSDVAVSKALQGTSDRPGRIRQGLA